MWKVSFNKETDKKVEVFNDKATVVTINAKVEIPGSFAKSMPIQVYDWMMKHSNPNIQFNPYIGIINLKAKGKTIKKDDDENKPLLAERLAECRTKMNIYKFMIALTEQYSKYYIGILIGKNKVLYPTNDSSKPDKNSVWGANAIFGELWNREYKLCIKLQKELGRWD